MKKKQTQSIDDSFGYVDLLQDAITLFEAARKASARSVNSIMTTSYWFLGKRIVEQEQKGNVRANYGEELLLRLAEDLTKRLGRGFSRRNLNQMRQFYLFWNSPLHFSKETKNYSITSSLEIWQTLSAKSFHSQEDTPPNFSLPWSHYVKLMSVASKEARDFYETEALRGGWSVRQLSRQIGSQFYERTLLSKNKMAMLQKGMIAKPEDFVSPEEEIKDPYVLEFLNLKDEYSESELEEALILHLEAFLLELGGDFTFVGRQKRLRVGSEWYRIDLVFFHRKLRCLILIDLKLEELTHADVGQMNLYVNYARENWSLKDENQPVGLILCSKKNSEVAHYALNGLQNKILAAEYKTSLPTEEQLTQEIQKVRRRIENRKSMTGDNKEKTEI